MGSSLRKIFTNENYPLYGRLLIQYNYSNLLDSLKLPEHEGLGPFPWHLIKIRFEAADKVGRGCTQALHEVL